MNLVQLNILLEEIYELPFLMKIEKIYEEEKIYKKSDFYKQYKISLINLYEKFELYQRANKDIKEEFDVWIDGILGKINHFIKEADTDLIALKIGEFLESVDANETIVNFINDLLENFDVSKVEELAKSFQKEVNNLKE